MSDSSYPHRPDAFLQNEKDATVTYPHRDRIAAAVLAAREDCNDIYEDRDALIVADALLERFEITPREPADDGFTPLDEADYASQAVALQALDDEWGPTARNYRAIAASIRSPFTSAGRGDWCSQDHALELLDAWAEPLREESHTPPPT